MLYTMATTFPPTFAGFHLGIMFTIRNASSLTSLFKFFFISVSRLVPSNSTMILIRAIPCLQFAVLLLGFFFITSYYKRVKCITPY